MYCKPGRFEFKDLWILRAYGPEILTICSSAKLLLALKKNYCQDLATKDMQWKVNNKKAWIQLLLYMLVGGEYLS